MQTGDKKSFKLAVVDSEPRLVTDEIENVRSFLSDKYCMELEPVTIDKRFESLDKIDDTVDIVIVHKRLRDADGVQLAGIIRSKHTLMDILVYSSGTITKEDLEHLTGYGMVETVRTRRFAGRLKNMIERSLSKWTDINYLRGITISRIIELETEINDVLKEVFLPFNEDRRQQFQDLVLENIDIPLQAKHRILKGMQDAEAKHRILKGMQDAEAKPMFNLSTLEKLQKERNILAHSRKDSERSDYLVRMGHDEHITKERITNIFNRAEKFSECLKAFRAN